MVKTRKKNELFTFIHYEKVTPYSHFGAFYDAVAHVLQQEELRSR